MLHSAGTLKKILILVAFCADKWWRSHNEHQLWSYPTPQSWEMWVVQSVFCTKRRSFDIGKVYWVLRRIFVSMHCNDLVILLQDSYPINSLKYLFVFFMPDLSWFNKLSVFCVFGKILIFPVFSFSSPGQYFILFTMIS